MFPNMILIEQVGADALSNKLDYSEQVTDNDYGKFTWCKSSMRSALQNSDCSTDQSEHWIVTNGAVLDECHALTHGMRCGLKGNLTETSIRDKVKWLVNA